MRILILIAIGLLLYIIIGNLLRKNRSTQADVVAGKMVKCDHCGVHILEDEALKANGYYYCSQEHLEQHDSSK